MRFRSSLIVVGIFVFSGCSALRKANEWAAKNAGPNEVAVSESVEEKRSESPVISEGSDYDRTSGTDYFWKIRENGATQLLWRELPSGYVSEITIASNGVMYSHIDGEFWTYNPWSDHCTSRRNHLKGMRCIHPVVTHFFDNHEFKPPHPLETRVR